MKEIEKIMTYALTITGICTDKQGDVFTSMNDNLFDYDKIEDEIDSAATLVKIKSSTWIMGRFFI
jgi:hypothetical protein